MALFRGIQEYIALDANNITLVFDSGNIVNISGNIFLYPPQGHPILYNYCQLKYMIMDVSCNGVSESYNQFSSKSQHYLRQLNFFLFIPYYITIYYYFAGY